MLIAGSLLSRTKGNILRILKKKFNLRQKTQIFLLALKAFPTFWELNYSPHQIASFLSWWEHPVMLNDEFLRQCTWHLLSSTTCGLQPACFPPFTNNKACFEANQVSFSPSQEGRAGRSPQSVINHLFPGLILGFLALVWAASWSRQHTDFWTRAAISGSNPCSAEAGAPAEPQNRLALYCSTGFCV